jgi:hypothetical protein
MPVANSWVALHHQSDNMDFLAIGLAPMLINSAATIASDVVGDLSHPCSHVAPVVGLLRQVPQC